MQDFPDWDGYENRFVSFPVPDMSKSGQEIIGRIYLYLPGNKGRPVE